MTKLSDHRAIVGFSIIQGGKIMHGTFKTTSISVHCLLGNIHVKLPYFHAQLLVKCRKYSQHTQKKSNHYEEHGYY